MLYTLLLSVAILLLLIYRVATEKGRAGLIKVLVFAVAIFLFYRLSYASALGLLGLLLFDVLITKYGRRAAYFFVVLAVLYLSLMYASNLVFLGAQAMLLGFISEKNFNKSASVRSSKRIEVRRDEVQVLLGIIFVLILYFLAIRLAVYIFLLLILLGYLLAGFAIANAKTRISLFLHDLERGGVNFGEGAIWLAIGVLIAVSFIQEKAIIFIIFAAIFFSDSMATIVGINLKGPRLPYNKKKSVAGTLAYLAILLILAYPEIGALSFVIAPIAAIIEGMAKRLDDNFAIPAVLAAIFILLRIFL